MFNLGISRSPIKGKFAPANEFACIRVYCSARWHRMEIETIYGSYRDLSYARGFPTVREH
jgi:hypothetical protein